MTGKQMQEKYLMPEGGLFEVVSCPHMLAEVVIYVGVLVILGPLTDWLWVTLWVLSNQVSHCCHQPELLRPESLFYLLFLEGCCTYKIFIIIWPLLWLASLVLLFTFLYYMLDLLSYLLLVYMYWCTDLLPLLPLPLHHYSHLLLLLIFIFLIFFLVLIHFHYCLFSALIFLAYCEGNDLPVPLHAYLEHHFISMSIPLVCFIAAWPSSGLPLLVGIHWACGLPAYLWCHAFFFPSKKYGIWLLYDILCYNI